MDDTASDANAEEQGTADGESVGRLLFLFATLYFIQGISEPAEGLISQPTRSLLRNWGYDAGAVSTFVGALVFP